MANKFKLKIFNILSKPLNSLGILKLNLVILWIVCKRWYFDTYLFYEYFVKDDNNNILSDFTFVRFNFWLQHLKILIIIIYILFCNNRLLYFFYKLFFKILKLTIFFGPMCALTFAKNK